MRLRSGAEQTARRQDRRLDLTSTWKRCMTRRGSICRAVTKQEHTREGTVATICNVHILVVRRGLGHVRSVIDNDSMKEYTVVYSTTKLYQDLRGSTDTFIAFTFQLRPRSLRQSRLASPRLA